MARNALNTLMKLMLSGAMDTRAMPPASLRTFPYPETPKPLAVACGASCDYL